jgi:hypothetical protein
MPIIPFEPENFECIYEGIIIGSALQPPQERVGLKTLEIEAKLMTRLHKISEPAPCGKRLATGDTARLLITPVMFELSRRELELIMKYFQSVPWVIVKSPQILEIWDDLVSIMNEGAKC